ncbi:hypothetical protein GCM10023189_01570 [Nibrella saemangeumensis]|uniref:Beta-carotene 15,15'-monooxygenase n=1 Tax=Nibrella saemangeumensis TaxID=1084526 RepID=A0ABP8M8L8_9BACT
MSFLMQSFLITRRSGRMLLVIYLVSLVLGLLVALPFYNTLRAETGRSLAFDALLDGFDYTVFTDFMHVHGKAISPLLSVGRWVSVVYLFLSLFFTGGILMRFAEPNRYVSMGAFWQACSHYFRRYLALFALVALTVALLAFIWLLTGTLLVMAFSDTLSERELFWIGFSCFLAFVLMATLVLCIGDYAKVDMMRRDEPNALRAFARASLLVIRHGRRTWGLYWLLLLISTGWFAVYLAFEGAIGMSSWTAIVLVFLIQQLFIFGRIGLKVVTLGVAWQVFDRLVPPPPVVYAGPVLTEATTTTANDPINGEPVEPTSGTGDTEKTAD